MEEQGVRSFESLSEREVLSLAVAPEEICERTLAVLSVH
jgi:hypothetical protein